MKLNIKKISIWLSIIMTVSFILAGISFVIEFMINNNKKETINIEKSFNAKSLKSISICTSTIPINILPNDSDQVKIHIYGKSIMPIPDIEIKNSLDGSDLNIIVKEKFVLNFCVFSEIYRNVKLEAFIPEKIFDALNVKCSSGDINLSKIKAKENTFDLSSGDININDLNGNLDVNCSSGSIHVKNLKGTEVNLRNLSGDTHIENLESKNLSIRLSSGNIKTDEINSKNTSIKNSSGSVELNNFTGNLNAELNSGNIYASFKEFKNTSVNIRCSSGSSKILIPDNSNFKIKCKLNSGSFKSDFQLKFEGFMKKNDFEGEFGTGSNNSIDIKASSGDVKILKK